MKLSRSLSTTVFRSLRACASAGIFLALAACSTVQSLGEIEHGRSVANRGDSRISNVVIQYGKITRRECVRGCPAKSEAGLWNAPMAIPDSMVVTWQTADGQQHQVNPQVKSRIKDPRRLRNLYFHFSGAQLIVIQGLDYDKPTIFEYEKLPLFP